MKRGPALLSLLAAAALGFAACGAPAALLTIDGRAVGEREYLVYMQRNVAGTVRYFQTAHGCAYTAGFWGGSAGGESPAEYLRQAAVSELVRCKVQEEMLRKEGLWPFDTYEAFLKGLEQENDRRGETVRTGGVIYGPEAYGEWEYYQYLLANGVTRLKQEYVGRGKIDTGEEKLKAFFKENPQLVSQPFDTVELELLRYPYAAGDGGIAEDAKAKAQQAALAGAALLETAPMKEVPDMQGQGELVQLRFSNESARGDSLLMPQVFAWAQAGKPGERSGVLEDNGAYWIAQVRARQTADPVRFEDAREHISAKYVDACFEELVQQAVEKARVELLAQEFPVPQAG